VLTLGGDPAAGPLLGTTNQMSFKEALRSLSNILIPSQVWKMIIQYGARGENMARIEVEIDGRGYCVPFD
jgi:hypothetical protein